MKGGEMKSGDRLVTFLSPHQQDKMLCSPLLAFGVGGVPISLGDDLPPRIL